ncbi:hypothetical protein X275_03705 [Marinitoga sp. 1197]|uniref:ATP-binding protein n=1 Tax=Marinitoga sp. 1197 TaxID=1428449 RepID=UPI0006411666|nr:ATP-binding protein [Marinitoga sp. 1197]KLO23263.1 hypothetical protein X275_03705 [Marinitoga sp. 1197]
MDNIFSNEYKKLENHKNFLKNNSFSVENLIDKYECLIKDYEHLLSQTKKISKISDINHMILIEMKKRLRLLLDNSDEGFLMFGKDFLIHNEYSKECLNIFETEDISKRNILELLYNTDYEIEKKILSHIFENDEKDDVYLELLPSEVKINNKILKVKYKIIYLDSVKRVMCIIQDITEKKELEEKIENEKNNTKMLLNVVMNRDIIKKNIEDYIRYVTKQVYNDIFLYSIQDFIMNFYKNIHTYKGLFLQWHFIKTGKKLDKLENELDLLKKSNIEDKNKVITFIKDRKLKTFLNEELNFINSVLGKDFLKNEMIWIDKNKIMNLEKYIENILPEEYSQLILAEIKKLYFKNIKDVLDVYKKYTFELAEKFGKKIDSFEIDSNLFIDIDDYYDFIKSLIHIFRNIVIHGIERPEERLILNKTPGGNIKCKIYEKENIIHIIISDDGKGIENIDKIFEYGYTSKYESNIYAGKGIGLYSVKNEVKNLNGKISVYSELNKGTTFSITIPRRYLCQKY